MGNQCDVAICYHSSDNNTTEDNPNGWVSNFKHFLELMLSQVLGAEPVIVILNENEIDSAILDESKVIIPVLSEFFISASAMSDLMNSYSESTDSVIKVLKSPVKLSDQPAGLRTINGYTLSRINPASGAIEDFVDFFSPEAEKYYWSKVADLSYDIHKILLKSAKENDKTSQGSDTGQLRIYLAEVAPDLRFQHSLVKRELERYGHLVLPTKALPTSYEALVADMSADIENCEMCIHLIGSDYGEIIEEVDQSILDIQSNISGEKAAAVNDKRKFSRLIWVKELDKSTSEKQLGFVESLKRDIDTSESSEILQTPLEDFKNIVRQKIGAIVATKGRKEEQESKIDLPSVYILHDKEDKEEIGVIKNLIEEAGYKVLLPAFEGQIVDLRERHLMHLRELDAAIIYKGKVNNQWVMMKVLDVLKAPGFGRTKPLKGKALVSSNKSELEAAGILNQSFTHIESNQMDALKKFLKELG